MNEMNYAKLGNAFKDIADVCFELNILEEKAEAGEQVEEEMEAALGKLMVKMLKLESLQK